MHARNFGIGGLGKEKIQGLGLANKGRTVPREVDDCFHWYLPGGAV